MASKGEPADNGEPTVSYQGPGYQKIATNDETKHGVKEKAKKRGRPDSAKVLLPFRPRNKKRSPMDTSGLISTMLYSFFTAIYWKSHRKGITQESLMYLMSDREAAARNSHRLERLWEEELAKKGEKEASFKRAVLRFVRTRVLMSCAVQIIANSSGFLLTAYLLYLAIIYLESPESSIGYSITLGFGIFLATVVRVMGNNFVFYINIRSAVRLRSALMLLIYRKVARLRSTSKVSVGEMVNICVNDIQRLHDSMLFGPLLFSFPIFFLFIFTGVVFVIGPIPALVGMATLIFFFSIQAFLAKINVRIRQKCVVFTDQRTRLMNELLNCIKLVKMYSWEESFAKKITDIRSNEKKYLTRSGILQCFTVGLSITITTAIVLASIVTYSLLGNVVKASTAFTLVHLFGSLTGTLFVIPLALKPISESVVALRRIQPILLMDESNHDWALPESSDNAIEVKDASFSWDAPPNSNSQSNNNDPGNGKPATTKYTLVKQEVDEENKDAKNELKEEGKEAAASDGLLVEETRPTASGVTLKNINLNVPRSHLIGICGSVGSGKSSFLNCLMDQMNLLKGDIALKGSFAFASQQAWITNATVRDNILFGEEYNEERYKKAIFSCCLERDLEIMSDGDQTEIGERGVNVSGGQKQRISLARAYYSDRDIYLLDDPLSAVDAHVGKHIFNHCINGVLRGKTILFVTHQLQYLCDCDYIVLMRDGAIAEQGTHDSLIQADMEYARLLETFHGKGEEDEEDVNDDIPPKEEDIVDDKVMADAGDEIKEHQDEDVNDGVEEDKEVTEVLKLIGTESEGEGTVAYATYQSFVRFTGGRFWAFLVPLLMFLTMLSSVATSIWLSIWIQAVTVWDDTPMQSFAPNLTRDSLPWSSTPLMNNSLSDVINGTSVDYDDDYYIDSTLGTPSAQDEGVMIFFISVYVGIFVLTWFILFVACCIFIKTVLRATTRIHDRLLRKIMRCPMAFFDTTPLGRILNRFSKDMDEVDMMLPIYLQRCLLFLSVLFLLQLVIIFIFPLYLAAFAVVIVIGLVLYIIFRKGYCQIKRMDNTSRSKVVSHISATMQGLTTIKAYGQGQRFINRFEKLLDTNSLIMELFSMAPRWTAARMDLMSSTLVLFLALLILLNKENIFSAAIAAMALQQAIGLSGGLLQEVLIACTQTESSFLSVERMLEYIQKTPSEADAHIEDTKPDQNWPAEGDLKIQNLEMRYRPKLPLVLKGVTCHIRPKEKIGIVGRTGSGKSSLGISLFRLVENVSGQILLDDVDISTVGLHDLRSKLSIIPQDPVLFAGTVRFNLDPLNQHTDEELWAALEKTYVKQTISCLDNQLEATVIENGENFSVGERQLMCMARALLRNSKVLLMDEATAAIDTETDSLIQQTIRDAFKECTILIIAHRLNTILDCDKVMLMDKGEIAEFDKPEVLQANPKSQFSGMLIAAQHNQGSLDD
ncbi:multidrug resistance-associated protein 5-like [Asterias rubens]|uniref:multidrug resistance-associated protein 5-like n=1 Tax=Asterias rubens TaxID=7604 RepID=UPI0014556FFE|nr:multidrug resistance-associated protein 5-like [Asterias rubens]